MMLRLEFEQSYLPRCAQDRKKVRDQAVDGFAVLEQTDYIMNTDASAFHPCVTAPDIRRPDDVPIGF